MRAGEERCPYILPGGEKRVEVSIEGEDFVATSTKYPNSPKISARAI